MPYVSKAQQRYFHENLPNLAREWDKKTTDFKDLPQHVNKNKSKAHIKARRRALKRLGLTNMRGLR